MARNWGRMNSTVKTVWTTTIPYKTFVHVIVSSVYKFTWYTACQVQEPCKETKGHAHHVQMYKPTWTQISTHKLWHSVIISFSCNTENIKHSCNKNYFLNYSNLPLLLTSMAPSCTTDKWCENDDDLSPSCRNGETEEPGIESADGR